MLRLARWLVLVLIGGTAIGQVSDSRNQCDQAKDHTMFATKRFVAKGGIGAIRSGLYIDLKSSINELRLAGGEKWLGRQRPSKEIVIYFDGQVRHPQSLPEGFDLSRAVIISFEGSRVRFFDFAKSSGGYYEVSSD